MSSISTQNAWRILFGVLALYAVTNAVLYPQIISVTDERSYVRQAAMILRGNEPLVEVNPFNGERLEIKSVDRFPLGTALFLLPFVGAFGSKGAHALSLLALLVGTALSARWIAERGRSPLFALLILGFPPSLVMGRVAMSDMPSMALVAAALLVFWRADGRSYGLGFAAGLLAGVTFMFRESNALVLAPLCAGSLLRRDRNWPAILAGGVLGLGLRVLAHSLFFEEPFHYVSPREFELGALARNVPLYAFALLVFVPGGLVLSLLYRGERRPEVVATIALYALFFSVYGYSGAESGLSRRLVLGPRFFIPLLPLMAFAMAESVPRVWRQVVAYWPERARLLDGIAKATVLAWLAAVVATTLGASWVHGDWVRAQARIRDAIYAHTPEGALLVTNTNATSKFIDSLLYGHRLKLRREGIGAAEVNYLRLKTPEFYLVFLDRSDSVLRRQDAEANARFLFLTRLDRTADKVYDERISATERLHIWRVPGTS